jgi:tetratricopeptide (TPR) repeat protein
MTLAFTLCLAVGVAGFGPIADSAVQPDAFGRQVAQTFTIEGETKEKAKPRKKVPKKPKEVKSEDDLWSEPADEGDKDKKGVKGKKEEDDGVEEISPDEIEDVGEGEGEGEGETAGTGDEEGWGADVERENWGDEERIKNAESLVDKEDEPPPKPDAGTRKPDPVAKSGADAGPSTAAAIDGGVDASTAGEVPEEGEDLVLPGKIKMPSGTVADLAALWEQRRIHISQRDFELAKEDLKRFLALKDELAIRNMYEHAQVLIRESRMARQAEDKEQAEALLAAAAAVAPDLPAAHFAQASMWFADSPFKLGRVFGALSRASKAAITEPLSANRLMVNLVVGLLLGFALSAVIFILIQFLRYLRLFFHDFHHLFPRGVARLQTGLLAVLVILIPIIFRTGLVSILLLWALIAWLYQQTRERVITFLAVALFATTPLVLNWVVTALYVPESVVSDVIAVDQGAAPEASISRLKSYLEEDPDNHVVLASLGGYYKRTGEFDLASQFLEKAAKVNPKSAVLQNNLGNVLFLKNDMDGAVKRYDRATKTGPDLVEPYYNLSRAYYAKMDHNKGKEHYSDANRLNSERVRQLRKAAKSDRARDAVADLPLPREWLAFRTNGTHGRQLKQASTHMWQNWGGAGSTDTFPYVGAGVAVFFGLMLLLRGRMYLSSACVRCGRPVCRRCNTELPDNTTCGQCFHAFKHKEQVDAKSRISKEIQIRQYRRRKERIARFITFVLPGVGQFIKDRPLRGALFLTVFCCVVVQVLFRNGVMADPHTLGSGIDWLKLVPLAVLFLGVYVWAILDAFRADV